MDKHDQLARRMLENNELSTAQSSIELSPLEQLIARVTVRWPFPEMGGLEYADWMEVLKSFHLSEIQQALYRLMRQPPKRELPDGSITEYRGRPTLVDVTRTIDILREERCQQIRAEQARQHAEQMRELEQRRKEHPEQFFGLADVLKAAKISDAKQIAKGMPSAKPEFPDIDPEANRAKLEQQKRELGQ